MTLDGDVFCAKTKNSGSSLAGGRRTPGVPARPHSRTIEPMSAT